MNEEKRYLITKVLANTTKAGKPIVQLFAGGEHSRLAYPVLSLFDPAMLLQVGVNPEKLPEHCAFYAYYTESEKTNAKGNPYKDIIRLESAVATGTTNATSYDPAIHKTLEQINAKLDFLVEQVTGKNAPEQKPVINSIPKSLQFSDGKEIPERMHTMFKMGISLHGDGWNPSATEFYTWANSSAIAT